VRRSVHVIENPSVMVSFDVFRDFHPFSVLSVLFHERNERKSHANVY
jgi:hypothetical protein